MKTQLITSVEYILTQEEKRLVLTCLDYCYHRLNKHKGSGIEGLVSEVKLNQAREFLRKN